MDNNKSNKKIRDIHTPNNKFKDKTDSNIKTELKSTKKNKENLKIITEIKEVIDSIRFYISQDGGDLEFVDYDSETGEVVIKLLGACVGCGLIDLTYKDGLETILKQEVKSVKSIKLIE